MTSGQAPFVTKGTFARLYGGEDLWNSLNEYSASTNIHYLIILAFTTGLQLLLFLYKRKKWENLSLIQTLKGIMVNNFLNLHSILMTLSTSVGLLTFLFLHQASSSFDSFEKDTAPTYVTSVMSFMLGGAFQSLPFISNPVLR